MNIKPTAYHFANAATQPPAIYRVTAEAGHTYFKSLNPDHIEWFIEQSANKGMPVASIEVYSTSTECAGCGCRWSDHFDGTGLCNLGFCRSQCGEFVPTI